MKVRIAEPDVTQEDINSVMDALRNRQISGKGAQTGEFEKRFAAWLGTKYGVATNTGTAALHLALVSLGIGPKDEVIIPAFSMAAIPFALHYVGAKPVLVDAETESWNMNPREIERKVTRRTLAIIVMHTYGHPADMDPIMETARKCELKVIEDASEAHGALYKGRKAGTIGDIGTFSFYANKIITTGEGGLIATNNAEIAERAKRLRDMAFGSNPAKRFQHESVGFNYRLGGLQAALGVSQLRRIDSYVEKRRNTAKFYNELLASVPGVHLHPEEPWARCVYWMYSILVDSRLYGSARDDLMEELSSRGIESRPFFTPVHKQPAFMRLHSREKHPHSERLGKSGLNLPSGNTISQEEVRYVADSIVAIQRGGAKIHV